MKKVTYTPEGIKKASEVSGIPEYKFVSRLCSEPTAADQSKTHTPSDREERLIKRASRCRTIPAAKGVFIVSPSGSESEKIALAKVYQFANSAS